MAADYVSFDEACELLNKSPDEMKVLVAEGKLRELRDAGKVFFRREEVKQVAAKEGSSIVELAPADQTPPPDAEEEQTESFASALSSLADESSGMGVLDQSPMAEPEELSFNESGASDASPPEASASESPPSESPVAEATDVGSAPAAPAPSASSEDSSPPIDLGAEDFPMDLPAAGKEEADEGSPQPAELTSEIDLLPASEGEAQSDEGGVSPFGGISPDLGLSPLEETAEAQQKKAAEEAQPADLDAEIPDFGLSGSSIISLEPSLDEVSEPAKAPEESKAKGISVFDEDEVQINVDPMGETQISSSVDELEAVGSGSGLLDLTQESDDTSLGPALLDVISPSEAAEAGEAGEEEPAIIEATETVDDAEPVLADGEGSAPQAALEAAMPAVATTAAPTAPAAMRPAAVAAMTGAVPTNITVFVGILALAVLGLATAAAIQGTWPWFMDYIARGMIAYISFGVLAAASLAFGIWAILSGRGK